jgi:hypothetical protein
MTPTETWHAWQAKLQAAQSALADFEANLGTLAQTEDAGVLAARLTELRDAVTIAEAATETARQAAPDPRVAQKQAQLERAQTMASEYNAKAAEWEAKYKALEGPFVEAKNNMLDYARQAMMHENAVIQYGLDLKQLQRG